MKKSYIKALTITVSVALLGLVAVQIYWIDNALSLQQDEFKRNVKDALKSVADRLEQADVVEHIRSHEEGRFLFIDSLAQEGLTNGNFDSSYNYVQLKQFTRIGDNEVELKVTEESDGKKSIRSTRTTPEMVDSINGGISLQTTNGELGVGFGQDKSPQLESVLRSSITQKTAFVGDIVKRLMEVDLFEPIEKRIDQNELDSLIGFELEARGISAKYQFGVYDYYENLHIANFEQTDILESKSRITQVRLFPNDVIQDPYFLRVYFPKQTKFLLKNIWLVLIASTLLMLALGFIFYFSVITIIEQKKNSEIKNDFINNMTHEFKTPISTISLACEALKDPDIGSNPTLVSRYIGMVNDENKRLGMLVEEVLQSAVFDKGEFKLKLESIDVHELILSVSEKVNMQVREKQGTLITHLKAENATLKADRVHLSNVLYNLIDNAIKYSKEHPQIELSTENHKEFLILSVKDNGIGISKENQKRIFDRLYRVPTGNLHDVKGFGLGLSYVKIIIDRLEGRIELDSQLGKGSTFNIYLPLYEKV